MRCMAGAEHAVDGMRTRDVHHLRPREARDEIGQRELREPLDAAKPGRDQLPSLSDNYYCYCNL